VNVLSKLSGAMTTLAVGPLGALIPTDHLRAWESAGQAIVDSSGKKGTVE